MKFDTYLSCKRKVMLSLNKSRASILDPTVMELLNKVISSNNFGLRKTFPWDGCLQAESTYLKTSISDSEKSYLANVIRYIFKKKTKLRIERLENPYLWGRYILQYEEMKADSETKNVEELIMIHATSRSNAYEIAETNFDWRLGKRARFGKGVCFAKHAQYTRQYASRKEAYIVAGVLVANSSPGTKKQKLPKGKDDTTTGKTERNVCVKYYDNDFYPYYIVQAM